MDEKNQIGWKAQNMKNQNMDWTMKIATHGEWKNPNFEWQHNQMWMEIAKGRWASKGEWKNLIWMKT